MDMVIFVAVVCINTKCDFISSTRPVTEQHCVAMKKQFLLLPFKSEITIAATQCMPFEYKEIKYAI